MFKRVEISPFLYTRNQDVDYDFVVCPKFMKNDSNSRRNLASVFKAVELNLKIFNFESSDTTLFGVFNSKAAMQSDANFCDRQGRPIFFAYGFLCKSDLSDTKCEEILNDLEDAWSDFLGLFWGWEKKGLLWASDVIEEIESKGIGRKEPIELPINEPIFFRWHSAQNIRLALIIIFSFSAGLAVAFSLSNKLVDLPEKQRGQIKDQQKYRPPVLNDR